MLHALEMLEGMRRVLRCMLEAVEAELCSLEAVEMMRCVLLCILEAVEGALCLWRCRRCRRVGSVCWRR